MMDQLDAMALAIAAIDDGSLSAAARRFGRSAAAATRAITLLEERAGEALLLRSTRGLRLTDAGRRHAAVWRDVLARLAEVKTEQPVGIIRGTLVISAPEIFGRLRVQPALESFLDQHQEVQARALLLNRVVDMVSEGVDISIRIAHLPNSNFVAVPLGKVLQIVCAAPSFLSKHGTPKTPADLIQYSCIGMSGEGNRELWNFRREARGTRMRSVPVQTRLSSTSVSAGLDAAIRGGGIIRVLSYQVAEDLAAGRLERVLWDYEPGAIPVNIIFRAHPHRWSPVRGFVDHAAPILRRELVNDSTLIGSLAGAEVDRPMITKR